MNKQNLSEQKQKTLIAYKKAHSLLSKIIKMMEDGHYCIDIMQQNLAVIGLLKSAHQDLMENHLNTCFKKAVESKNEKREKEMIEEILKVTKLFNK
jgi:DNA-binding FrmR family transcriptional regulator